MLTMQMKTVIGFLFLLSRAAPSLTDRVSVGVFLVQGLLMVCNHLTTHLTSGAPAA